MDLRAGDKRPYNPITDAGGRGHGRSEGHGLGMQKGRACRSSPLVIPFLKAWGRRVDQGVRRFSCRLHLGQVVGEPSVFGLEALGVSLYWHPYYYPRLKHGRHNGFAMLVVCSFPHLWQNFSS